MSVGGGVVVEPGCCVVALGCAFDELEQAPMSKHPTITAVAGTLRDLNTDPPLIVWGHKV